MAIAVIGGLLSSTVLSLLFVPAVFAVMDDIAGLLWRCTQPLIGATDEPPPLAARSAAAQDPSPSSQAR